MASPDVTINEYNLVAVCDAVSVTVTLTLNGLPVTTDGVPDSTPAALTVRPVGNPVADHV